MEKIGGILPYSARFVGLGGGFIYRKKFSDGLKDAARASPCYASPLYFPFRAIHHVYKEKTRSVALAACAVFFIAVSWLVLALSDILTPFIVAAVLAYILNPLVEKLRDKGVSRRPCIDVGHDVRPAHTAGTAADSDTDAADTVSKPDQPSAAADRLRPKQSTALV